MSAPTSTSIRHRLEPFNPPHNTVHEATPASFHRFQQLPRELRLDIWDLSLSRGRILYIQLENVVYNGDDLKISDRFGRTNSGQNEYTIIVRGRQVLSKLLHVNCESRKAAMRFYRVHLPCQLGSQNSIIYLNPEWDILQVAVGKGGANFSSLIHDMKARDPLSVGLRNLALLDHDINRLDALDPSRLSPDARAAFMGAIASLQHLYFLSFESFGRISSRDSESEFHRSLPVFSSVPFFDKQKDPRPIQEDLEQVNVGNFDPRRMVFHWIKLVESWNVQLKTEYHFMLSHNPYMGDFVKGSIANRQDARDWIEGEDEDWALIQLDNSRRTSIVSRSRKRLMGWVEAQLSRATSIVPGGRKAPLESLDELKAGHQTAMGFWVFPIEALGPLPSNEESYNHRSSFWKRGRVLDMSKYWPDIYLSYLP